jgi:glyoxylase-like metal-dependent hydrolase (beta-lactamase superfamily II)
MPGVHVIDAPFADGLVPLEIHVVLGARPVIMDAGTADSPAQHLVPALEELGVEPEVLAVTHAHEDHVGGAEPLRGRFPQLRVAVHRDDVGWAESVPRFWEELYLRHRAEWTPGPEQKTAILAMCGSGTRVDLVLEDGDALEGTGLTVVAAPSHSPGHVVYWAEEDGALFVGDALQAAGVPLREGPGVFPQYLDVPSYLATIERLVALEPEVIYTSHFGIRRGAEARELLDRSRSFVAELHELVLSLLSDRPQRLAEVAIGVHGHHPGFFPWLQLHVTTYSHLRQHVAEGAAAATIVDGVERWTRA